MKINKITATLAVLTMLVLPTVSFANTYLYVDSGGRLQSMQANSSTEALATAPNIKFNSGVMLVSAGEFIGGIGGSFESPVNLSGTFYQFVDVNGNIQSINAGSSAEALANAVNIAPNSGVILVTSSTSLTN
jgi:hypothetical protein